MNDFLKTIKSDGRNSVKENKEQVHFYTGTRCISCETTKAFSLERSSGYQLVIYVNVTASVLSLKN